MLLQKIKTMTNFTNTEKVIADYILANADNIEQLTIQELARKTYTSHASIIRFTRKLGLDGFKSFKIELLKTHQQENHVLSEINPNVPFEHDDSILKISREMMELTQQTISESYHLLDEQMLFQATRQLYDAQRIFLFAVGDSQIRAESFQNKLWKINQYAILATDRSEWAVHTANITSKDCALFISYDAKSPHDITAAKWLKSRRVPIILLTSHITSSLSKMADICIAVPNLEDKSELKIATFASQIAFDYILNVIFSTIYQIDYEKNKDYQTLNQQFLSDNNA